MMNLTKNLFVLTLLAMTTTHIQAQDWDFSEVSYSPQQTTFRLFAPPRAKVLVSIGGQNATDNRRSVRMKRNKDGIYEAVVKGDLNHQPYRFSVDGRLSNGVFAKAVYVNGAAAQVLDLRETDPEGWTADCRPVVKSPADLVLYELHHRDFSIARKDAKYPGKFLALTEPWAIRHLKELGVNAVHILPSYDYGSVDESRLDQPQYNWGYDPVNYNVPEGSYSTDPSVPATRIREFKQMVQALHRAGIRVILDVVYNHTYDIEHSNFQLTYPDYYYRKVPLPSPQEGTPLLSPQDGAPLLSPQGGKTSRASELPPQGEGWGGAFSNGSGCGNETASERPMMRRFMIESVKYWINEYHIDGFRFDLMGCHDIETMNEIRKAVDEIDPTIFIYGEGWSAGQCALPAEQLATKANIPQLPRIAAFSDELRDALRGPFNDDTKGAFLTAPLSSPQDGAPLTSPHLSSLMFGIAGCIRHPQVDMSKVNYSKEAWATEPTQMISYVSCHDDMCLVDRLKATMPAPLLSPQEGAPLLSPQGGKTCADGSASELPPQGEGWGGASPLLLEGVGEALIRLDLLAQTAVFTSQGVPFMLSGEEMLRDKKGVHNSYESPDSINHLDWDNLKRYPQVFKYYKDLIQLRKDHPAFRLGSAELVRKHLEFVPLLSPQDGAPLLSGKTSRASVLPPQGEGWGGALVFRLKDHAGGDAWKDIYVVLNPQPQPITVSLPMDSYETVCDDGRICFTGIRHFTADHVVVAPQSALILHN